MYEAYIYDSFLDCNADLEKLIRSLTSCWELEPGEDVAIWHADRTLVAVIKGTPTGAKVIRLAEAPAAAVA